MKKQKQSELYWKNSQDSHLAPVEFYIKKKEILSNILDKIPNVDNALDIGCGNGEFTSLLLDKANSIKGYDISAPLLERAIKNHGDNHKLSFTCASIDNIKEESHSFDLILCMGVMSCVIADEKYKNLVSEISRLATKNSYVIVGDSLSIEEEILFNGDNDYVAKYRNKHNYLQTLINSGLVLLSEHTIVKCFSDKVENKLLLFKKD